MRAAPVGNYGAVKTPFAAQNGIQKIGVFIAVNAVDLVVSRHNRLRLRRLYRYFERGQINFAQGTRVHDAVADHSAELRIVRRKVLYARADPVRAQTADVRRAQSAV